LFIKIYKQPGKTENNHADGSESFCGNGSRCAIHLAHTLGWFNGTTLFKSNDGIHKGKIEADLVSLEMHLTSPPNSINQQDTELNTGSPHYVHRSDKNTKLDIVEYGKSIRFSESYEEEGINVNVYRVEGDTLYLRTYERGVEDETLSCGTGVTAVAISHFVNHNKSEGKHQIKLQSEGGELSVNFNFKGGEFSEIYLTGPAIRVFDGIIKV
jgi:diaminopimelate epimerase